MAELDPFDARGPNGDSDLAGGRSGIRGSEEYDRIVQLGPTGMLRGLVVVSWAQ